jgi:two-component system CheB/CheR fusion protein
VTLAGVAAAFYGGFESALFAAILNALAIFAWVRIPNYYHYSPKVIPLEMTIFGVSLFLAWTGIARRRAECLRAAAIGELQLYRQSVSAREIGVEVAVNLQHRSDEQLAVEIHRAAELERWRIAEILHDEIGQSLALCQMKLELFEETGDAERNIEPAIELVAGAIRQTRSLISELNPPADREFYIALHALARRIEREKGLTVAVDDSEGPGILDDELRGILFRIVRELLLNAVKHAEARTISITIRQRGESILAEVKDDGRGIDPAKLPSFPEVSGGFGLLSIRKRVADLGGHIDLISAAGHGTQWVIEIPIVSHKLPALPQH